MLRKKKSRNRDIILKSTPCCAILLMVDCSHAQEGYFYDLQLYLHQMVLYQLMKTQMRLQAGISTNILAKMGKGEPVAMESLAKIATALDCGLDDIVEISTKN